MVLEIAQNNGQRRMISTGRWLSEISQLKFGRKNSLVHLAECPSSPNADSKWGSQPLASACHRAAWWAERKKKEKKSQMNRLWAWPSSGLKFTRCTSTLRENFSKLPWRPFFSPLILKGNFLLALTWETDGESKANFCHWKKMGGWGGGGSLSQYPYCGSRWWMMSEAVTEATVNQSSKRKSSERPQVARLITKWPSVTMQTEPIGGRKRLLQRAKEACGM